MLNNYRPITKDVEVIITESLLWCYSDDTHPIQRDIYVYIFWPQFTISYICINNYNKLINKNLASKWFYLSFLHISWYVMNKKWGSILCTLKIVWVDTYRRIYPRLHRAHWKWKESLCRYNFFRGHTIKKR